MKLRVLHLLEAVQFGTVRHLTGVVRYVDAEHTVVIPPEGSGRYTDLDALAQMRADGARVQFVAMRRSPIHPHNAAAVLRVRRLIRRERPHVVHGHSSIGGAVSRIAAVGTPARTCYTPNGLLPSRVAMTMERALGAMTGRLIASSASEAALVERLRLVPRERVAIIPNAIETEVPAPIGLRQRLGIDPGAPVVGNVGRLAAQKAPEVFVRACAQVAAMYPDVHFVLVGEGELQDLVEREIASGGFAGRFHLVNLPTGADAAMAEFDIFAMPSRYEAGAPFSAMEAMRAEVPVILTNVVGNRDAVENGVSGLLVPDNDPSALAVAVCRLLADTELARAIAVKGRERLMAEYDIRKIADTLRNLYESLAAPRDSRVNSG